MDICKAFDSVWHDGLLKKLVKLESPNYLVWIIKEFLTQRKIQVKIGNTLSPTFSPEQGVPQGSPLSPFLYNLFCYDMYNLDHLNINRQSYILQYADDTVLITHGKTTTEATVKLQELTNQVSSWMSKWRILPSPSKSRLLLFHHKIKENSPTINIMQSTVEPSTF